MTIQASQLAGGGLGTGDWGLRGAGSNGRDFLSATSPQPLAPSSGNDTPELKKAFTDFVGQSFFGELLKQMRATVGKPAYMHGGFGEDVFQSQLDQVLVERISDASASTFSDPMYQLMLARRA